MKTYEKPRLMALSLSGNEQLCGSCTNTLYDDPDLAEFINSSVNGELDTDGDGNLTKSEMDRAFGPSEGCAVPVLSYCKFNSTGMMVAWS